jgi:hypothetical protein
MPCVLFDHHAPSSAETGEVWLWAKCAFIPASSLATWPATSHRVDIVEPGLWHKADPYVVKSVPRRARPDSRRRRRQVGQRGIHAPYASVDYPW